MYKKRNFLQVQRGSRSELLETNGTIENEVVIFWNGVNSNQIHVFCDDIQLVNNKTRVVTRCNECVNNQ